MADEFQVSGQNPDALFTLKLHRGDGMTLLAMNWKDDTPPDNFVGFAIEYKEPDGDRFYTVKNRICFPGVNYKDPKNLPTLRSPIQKFRWVHFPRNADFPGEFTYRVSPVFMNNLKELSYGQPQTASIELRRQTCPDKLNVAFTRGFVSSQAFVDRYLSKGPIATLLPARAEEGLTFVPTHPQTTDALKWMGFEARSAILEALDQAIADKKAQVRVVAYDLNEPDIVSRLEKLGSRLQVIIDDDGSHGEPDSAENQAEQRLSSSAGAQNVKRQHMGKLQHNKTIVVDGPKTKTVVCGSTNFSWRGFFVQANNAVILSGTNPVKVFRSAFDNYWNNDKPADFAKTDSANWTDLGIEGIKGKVAFSPRSKADALLDSIANDVGKTRSCLFYSLAFLYQTPGAMQDAIKKVSLDDEIFVYGISDRKVGGLDLQKPGGNVSPVYPSALAGKTVPEPFKSEPTGGGGNRMHHKFIVIDFDKPDARVYLGSFNFSSAADTQNGENLVLIRDRRIAVSYTIEALRIFDHYHFRVSQRDAKKAKKKLELALPPKPGQVAWWKEDYEDPRKIRDRELFA